MRSLGKRLDKMRYFGGLGKRNFLKDNKELVKKLDRYRFMGNIGK